MKFLRPMVVAAAVTLAACSAGKTTSLGRTRAAPPAMVATIQLLGPKGELSGTATLEQRGVATNVAATVTGLPAGVYAIHLHAVGKCDAPDFTTAGPHFNPAQKMHGRDNPMGPHAGDLPNVVVGADGSGSVDFDVAGLTLRGGAAPLLDADGAAVVVHAGPDDYRTDPSGNSGARIACGLSLGRP